MTSPSSDGLSRSSGVSSRATSKSISESQRVQDCKSIVCHARHDTKVGFRFIRFSKLSYVQRKSFTRHLLNLVPSIVTLRYYIFGPPQAEKQQINFLFTVWQYFLARRIFKLSAVFFQIFGTNYPNLEIYTRFSREKNYTRFSPKKNRV